MKFRKIFLFELGYQLRQFSTWLLLSVFLLFGFLILRLVTLTDDTYLNAPGTIAFFTVFGSAIWLIIGGVVAGEAAIRDIQTHMHPLTYTTPVSKLHYLGGRFLAALALNAMILLALSAGAFLSFYGPGAKTEFIGPFRLISYLTNYGFLALPVAVATTAIQFAFAVRSRKAVAAYIASLLLIIFSQLGGTTVRFALDWKVLGSLMDLLGTSIVADMEGWTPIEKNNRLVLLEGTWLWNRIFWFSLAAAALVFTYLRFRLAHPAPASGRFRLFRSRSAQPAPVVSAHAPQPLKREKTQVNVPHIQRHFVPATYLRQVLTIAFTSFGTILRSPGGLVLVAVLAIGTGLFATEYMEFFGVPLFARTQEVLRVIAPPLSSLKTTWVLIPLLTIFYAGELVWHEREARLNELSDTSPVPEWVLLLGKFTGLALVLITWVAFLLLAGIINQLVMGYPHFEFGVYVCALFGIQLTNYLLFALLVFGLHVLVNQKYIGHMAAIGAYGFLVFANLLGIEHHLLIYASDPGWTYSDMSGFAPYLEPWLWFKFYWASWAFLLAVIATLCWVRSKETGLKARLHLARHRLPKYKPALATALVLVAVTGSVVFYNTNVRNHYLGQADRLQLRAEYEQRYGKFENSPRPALTRTRLQVELYPDERSADIRGTYFLVNRGSAPIDSIHLSTLPYDGVKAFTYNRAATAALLDHAHGYQIYTLQNPLLPGDSVQVRFELPIRPHGFSNEGVESPVLANGTHLTNDWLPIIGFDENRSLRNPKDRARHGLPPRPLRPSLYDEAARYHTRHAERLHVEAIVGTAESQTAVAPGALLRSWTKGNRHYFHYATNSPILNDYALFSARYAVQEALWTPDSIPSGSAAAVTAASAAKLTGGTARPVMVQVFYHPEHAANIRRMIRSAQASLTYFSHQFGPYPYSHFRVLERPGHGRGMHANPMTIDYQEGYSLMNPQPHGLDLPFHIMAHEMAHQWWGLYLAPAAVEGAGFLVESFATYSAMQVVEETLGYEHLLRYLSQMRQEYEVPRSKAAPPLLRANNRFMNYRKGPFALFALRHYIGKDKVNDALRELLRNYRPAPPLPTTLDFYREIQAVTPDSLHYLLHDLFAANTFWQLRTEQATTRQTHTGTWQVKLEVEARKTTVDSTGNEKQIPMHDWIEIGVYGAPAKGSNSATALYLQKHRIASGRQTITVTVPEKPLRAGIDPNHLLIDLEMEDNVKKVTVAGEAAAKEEPDLI